MPALSVGAGINTERVGMVGADCGQYLLPVSCAIVYKPCFEVVTPTNERIVVQRDACAETLCYSAGWFIVI